MISAPVISALAESISMNGRSILSNQNLRREIQDLKSQIDELQNGFANFSITKYFIYATAAIAIPIGAFVLQLYRKDLMLLVSDIVQKLLEAWS